MTLSSQKNDAHPIASISKAYSWRIIAVSTLVLPLLAVPAAKDIFRLPKELLVRAEAIALLVVAIPLLWNSEFRIPRVAGWTHAVRIIVLLIFWLLLTTVTSSNPRLSVESLVTFGSLLIVFVSIASLAAKRGLSSVHLLLAPALVNAGIVILQVSYRWNPFTWSFDLPPDLAAHGLIGNPSDVGSFLVPVSLASFAMAVAATRYRWMYVGIGLVALVALLLSVTFTAMFAFAAGALALAMVGSWKHGTAMLLASLIVAAILLVSYEPITRGTRRLIYLARVGEYDELLSNRITSFATAWSMVEAHPFTGVGPGTFGWNYLPFRLRTQREYPTLMRSVGSNFGEVHNDHLEILAETGIPGYLLFISALVFIASGSFEREASREVERARFARLLSLPLALSLFVLSLGQFPLQIATPAYAYLYLAALCIAWKKVDQ